MDPIGHFLQCRYCLALNPIYLSTSRTSSAETRSGSEATNHNFSGNEPSVSHSQAVVDEEPTGSADEAGFDLDDSDDYNENINETIIDLNTLSYKYRMVKRDERIREDCASNRDLPKDACSICLCAYETNCEVRRLPCMHMFHTQCVDRWLEGRLTCPICRLSIVQNGSSRQREY